MPATHPALHPGRCAAVELDGVRIGFVGELHPKLAPGLRTADWHRCCSSSTPSALEQRTLPAFEPIPRQQSAWRDLALIVGERVSHDALMDAIDAGPHGVVRSARLFDVYKPAAATRDIAAGERSLAVRLELLDDESTLTDERIEAEVARVIAKLGAQARRAPAGLKADSIMNDKKNDRGAAAHARDAHPDQGRAGRVAVRAPGAEQARIEGHGRCLLRHHPCHARRRART